MRKQITAALVILGMLLPNFAFAQATTVQGGTGTSSPSGILYGDGTLHMKTVVIGPNMTFSGGTLSSTGGAASGGWPFTPSIYSGVSNQSTTTPFWLKNTQIIASTTLFTMASTSGFTNSGPTWLTNLTNGQLLSLGANGLVQSTTTIGNNQLANSAVTVTANSPLTGGGSASLGGSTSLGLQAASASQNGYLALADFSLIHAATSTFTSPLIYTLGTNAVTCQTASGSQAGCIATVDWSRFNSATTTFSSPLVYTLSTNAVTCSTCSTASAANPTASLGLSAVNGSAATFMRSDGAPALSQAIVPTWTALHIFSANASSTQFSSFTRSYFGATATTTITSQGLIGAATSTPFWLLTAASSTGPQIGLTDGTASSNAWTIRSISNTLYIATSTATATSTTAAFSIGTNGTTTIQNGVNILAGCFSIAGTCLSTGGSSFSGTTGQVDYFSGTNTAVGTSSVFIATTQNVGVGTTSPYGILSVTGPALVSSLASTSVWSVNGTYTYTTPANTAFLIVQAWGGGGAGGGKAGVPGGGGGAGGFVASTTINGPSASYTLKVAQGGQQTTGGTGFASGGDGAGGNGGGGGGSTGFGSTVIACGGGGGAGNNSTGGGSPASGTSGGAGGAGGNVGGGGGCATAGSGSTGGTGGTSVTGTGGTGGSASTSSGGGGGSSAGVSGNGNSGGSGGGSGGAGGAGSGGATDGVNGTGANSGGGGTGTSGFSGLPATYNGGKPGAGGGGLATGTGQTTVGNGGDGKIIVYAYTYAVGSPLIVASFSTTTTAISLSSTGNGGSAFDIGTTTIKATLSIASVAGDIAESIWGTISGISYLFQQIDSVGHLITGGPNPTCGTGCASVTGDDRTMEVVAGSGVTSIAVNFANTYTTSPVCIPSEENAGVVALGASTTPTVLTITAASALTTKTIAVICQISKNFTF